jgi:putative chitinase
MSLITPEILGNIVPTLSIDRATILSCLINHVCPKYGINSKDIFEEFVSQVAHESGGFRLKTENLNYSTGALLNTFKKYFPTLALAQQYARQPEKIGNKVYANRLGNSNEQSGDGFRFRGGGFIQLTGKNIYQEYATYIKKPLLTTVTLVRESDEFALDSACWFFAIVKGLIKLAIEDNFLEITRRINGGYNGLIDRQEYYKRAKQYLI